MIWNVCCKTCQKHKLKLNETHAGWMNKNKITDVPMPPSRQECRALFAEKFPEGQDDSANSIDGVQEN